MKTDTLPLQNMSHDESSGMFVILEYFTSMQCFFFFFFLIAFRKRLINDHFVHGRPMSFIVSRIQSLGKGYN